MKRIYCLFFLVVTLLTVGTFLFSSCSNDEAEDVKKEKIEFLKTKAKDFAKKYDVEMSLNEENIDQIVESLTVEQMEKDFQTFASLKNAFFVDVEKAPTRTKGLKIKRVKDTEEEEPFDRDKEYRGGDSKEKEVGSDLVKVILSWHYQQTGGGCVHVLGNLEHDGEIIAHAKDTPSAHFATSSGRVTFEVQGGLTFITKRYTISVLYTADQDHIIQLK